ncbi:caspase family protein [Spirosoma litoris]
MSKKWKWTLFVNVCWLLSFSLYAQNVQFTWVSPEHLNYSVQPVRTHQEQITLQMDIALPASWQAQGATVRLLRNGKEVLPDGPKLGVVSLKSSKEGKVQLTQQVTLLPGDNTWEMEIRSGSGEVLRSQPLYMIHKPGKPLLHLICVGVPYNLTYTQLDAAHIFAYFKTQEGSLFSKVNGQVLICDEETRFSSLGQTMTDLRDQGLCAEDILVVFFSGHGQSSSAFGSLDFGLVSNDAGHNVRDERYVLFFYQKDIIKNLEMVPCKRIVLLDACHSGTADGNKNWIGSFEQAQSVLSQTPSGIVTLVSSKDNELSYENPRWKHGAFTKAILEGLSGHANAVDPTTGKTDRFITIGELANYVIGRVPDMVDSVYHRPQHPKLAHTLEADYPIFNLKTEKKADLVINPCSSEVVKPNPAPSPSPVRISFIGVLPGASEVDIKVTNEAVKHLKAAWPNKEVHSGMAQVGRLVRDGTITTILDGYKSTNPGIFDQVEANELCVITRYQTEYAPVKGSDSAKWYVQTTVRFTFLDLKTQTTKDEQEFKEIGTGPTQEIALAKAIESSFSALAKAKK